LRPLRGKNRAVLPGLRLKLFFEPAPHPLAAFGFDFQLHLTQPFAGACIRVHAFAFRCCCFVSDEEPTFSGSIMVRVSSCALSMVRLKRAIATMDKFIPDPN
jgi:hypothetical protein